MAAPTPIAPAPSTTSFFLSIRRSMAAAIPSSDTLTTSSTYLFISGNVSSPIFFTAMPSAIVGRAAASSGLPALIASTHEGEASACTPITFIPGLLSLMAQAMPEISPRRRWVR